MTVPIETLVGLTLASYRKGFDRDENHCLLMRTTCGRTFRMRHRQDCCERVYIEDIAGDLSDLVGAEIMFAYESSSPTPKHDGAPSGGVSQTWTYYRIGTHKGHVVIRWWGQSNGNYSERVDFIETMRTVRGA